MANRIPQDFLEQLLSRVDIVEVIDARVPLRKTGRDYSACCPFHAEKTPSFTVSPTKQFYHCFGCGAHGSAIGFLMAYEHLGFIDAVEELARLVGLELPHRVAAAQDGQNDLLALIEQAAQFFRRQLREHPTRQKAIDYLRNRGLNGETIHTFGIGYAPPGWDNLCKTLLPRGTIPKDLITVGLAIERDSGEIYDRFRERIIFPIRDRRGHTIAFGGRALGEMTPKYLNSPETPLFHKGQELYGLYEARMSERHLQRLLVVEGYMDVVALAQHGIRYAVATLGTATTPEHLERSFRMTNNLFFCFDGDRAGREAAWRALENTLPLLRDGRQANFLFLPEGEDPDSLIRKEGQQAFEQRMAEASPLSDYFFEHLSATVDIHSIDGRARLAERARPLLSRLPDSLYRDLMLQRLADLAGIDKEHIEKRLTVSTLKPTDRGSINPTRTPVRLAIALLLNRPDLAQKVSDIDRFKKLPVPGLGLLLELIEMLQSHPHINSVALILTRYQGTEMERILTRLAQWKPEYAEKSYEKHAEDPYEKEFLGILEHLEKRYSPHQILLENAILKGKLDELSAEERQLLKDISRTK
jgi:DNA primase